MTSIFRFPGTLKVPLGKCFSHSAGMQKLLRYGFRNYQKRLNAQPGQPANYGGFNHLVIVLAQSSACCGLRAQTAIHKDRQMPKLVNLVQPFCYCINHSLKDPIKSKLRFPWIYTTNTSHIAIVTYWMAVNIQDSHTDQLLQLETLRTFPDTNSGCCVNRLTTVWFVVQLIRGWDTEQSWIFMTVPGWS